jgi:hypothetical protein
MITTRDITFEEKLDWDALLKESATATFFQTKEWMQLWLKHFPHTYRLQGVFDGKDLIGIIPFLKTQAGQEFIGLAPVLGKELVSDFGDIITKTSYERIVWQEVLVKIKSQISNIKNGPVAFNFIRENSPSFDILKQSGGILEVADVAPFIELPKSWDEYLLSLDRHDRHELRRKMRKLEAEGATTRQGSPAKKEIDDFFRLVSLSSEQKRDFLTDQMKAFFTEMIGQFYALGIVRLIFLDLGGISIASILTFEYHNEVLLYNSGFDPNYIRLSPGFILNAYAIKDAIGKENKRFDFLRGGERYKYDLGAQERKLYKITF